MATIVTRAGKGSALTFTEGDANFTNLNTDKIENVVEDLTPQLGGNLDVQGNTITTSVTNGNIAIQPNGTGIVSINKSTTLTAGNLTVSAGSISAPTILNVTNSYTPGAQFFMGQSHTTADANNIAFGRSRGTVTSQAAVQNADELFDLVVVANDGSATTAAGSKLAWGITTTMTDAPSTNLLPHRTDFRVNTTVGAAATYMSVANDAVVRVRELGTTSDVTNLNISAGTDGNIEISPNGNGRVVIDGSDATDGVGVLEVGDIVNSGTDSLVLSSSAGLEFSAGSEGITWEAETDSVMETYITVDPATGNIELTPQGSGVIDFGESLPGSSIQYRRTFGCFHKTAAVTAAAADTVYEFDWTSDVTSHVNTQGVTVSDTSRLNIDAAGDYMVTLEFQAKNTDNADRLVWIWLAKNGTDLTETAIQVKLQKENEQIITKQWLVEGVTAAQYLEVRFAVDDESGISLQTVASQASPFVRPAVPSATITITPVGA